MSEQRTINALVATAFPNAYFLDEGLWQASANPEHLDSLSELAGLANPTRVRSRVWEAIQQSWRQHNASSNRPLNRRYPEPVVPQAEFKMLQYDRVQVKPGYTTFVCPAPSCERVFTLEQISRTGYKCPDHRNITVVQLAHLFVHADCGSVSLITPTNCWNQFDGQRCGAPLRLHLVYQQMDASYWWCPRCRDQRKLAPSSRNGQPGWRLSLRQRCDSCSVPGQAPVMMRLTTARTVHKAQRVDLVDMSSASCTTLLDEWFGTSVNDQAILADLPPWQRGAFQADPQLRERIRQMYRSQAARSAQLPAIDPPVQEELSDFAATRGSVVRRLDGTRIAVADILAANYGIVASLLDNLAIVRGTYGYLVGSSDPQQAVLKVFRMGGPRYAVLTQRQATEALLFEFIPERVLAWLHKRGLAAGLVDVTGLRRYIVTCPQNDPVLTVVTGLVHTAAHALRRSSERYTGVSGDAVDELIFARGLACVLYNNRGSELGMFTTTFEGRMREWLAGTHYDMLNCPLDPLCMQDDVAACPGCLYVRESGCTGFWNRALDRQYLVSLPTLRPLPGYWNGN